jgi:hypothetical protein
MRRLALLLLTTLALTACENNIIKPAEAVADKPWLRIERSANLDSGAWLGVVCDTVNGNLLYLYGNGNGRAAVMVPGGCK